MTSIGIRELRDGLSKHIADVLRGAMITVTDRGTPGARIVPRRGPVRLGAADRRGRRSAPAHRKRPAPDPVIADLSLSEAVLADRR